MTGSHGVSWKPIPTSGAGMHSRAEHGNEEMVDALLCCLSPTRRSLATGQISPKGASDNLYINWAAA